MADEPALPPHQHHHQHHPHIHHYHHPPPPFHHHSHSPHHHHHHHPHHQPPPPPPFLCARCKCWNFPANPNFNPNPYPSAHPNPAVCLQAQELPLVNPNAASTDLQAQEIPSDRFDAEEEEDEEEGYEFVMTDEWMEFFAKSEARRQEKKRQQKKTARDMRKATRAQSQAHEPSTVE